jgi:hypothetical protein
LTAPLLSPTPPPLQVIANNLPHDEVRGMKHLFQDMDRDRSGTISVDEFLAALRRKGSSIPEADMVRMDGCMAGWMDGWMDGVARVHKEARSPPHPGGRHGAGV